MPGATMCVLCLELTGDVPILKRFDEIIGDGERVETYFYSDPRIQREILRSNTLVADAESFAVAVGDDSHLSAERGASLDIARSLSTVFDDDAEPANKTTSQIAELVFN